jgi:uncharacterized membrane protein (DUF4010 family)
VLCWPRYEAGVNQAIDFVAHPGEALLRLLVAGLIGGLIGVERERAAHESGEEMFAGVRTFPLFALLGASLTVVTGEMGSAVVAGFLAVAALAVAAYWRTSSIKRAGMTTEVAALATYWIGAIAGAGALVLAAAIGITIAVLLAAKERLESLPRTMSREELRATLTLAVLAAVILPLLPDQNYGPWGVWNPRGLWIVIVLVCGLSFAAFLAVRFWGERRGVYVTGVLGGLASSTAVTVSLASQSRSAPNGAALAVGAGLASTVMLVRVAVLVAVAGPVVLPRLGPFLGAAAVGGILAIAFLARRSPSDATKGATLTNPFQLREAIRFGVIFALVLLVVEAARHYLGSWGIVAASFLAGFVDVDAITLSLSGMSGRGMPVEIAAGGIAVAVLANTAAKMGYSAWRGSPGYRKGVALILGATLAAGLIALVALGLRP